MQMRKVKDTFMLFFGLFTVKSGCGPLLTGCSLATEGQICEE